MAQKKTSNSELRQQIKKLDDQIQDYEKKLAAEKKEEGKLDEIAHSLFLKKKDLEKQIAEHTLSEPDYIKKEEKQLRERAKKDQEKLVYYLESRAKYSSLANDVKEDLAILEDEISEKIKFYKEQLNQQEQILNEINQRITYAEENEQSYCDQIVQAGPIELFDQCPDISSLEELEKYQNHLINTSRIIFKQQENLEKMVLKFSQEIAILENDPDCLKENELDTT